MLLEKFEKFIEFEPNTGCWLWIGSRSTNGYGIKKVNGRNCTIHRLTWEEKNGPIPAKMELDHLCRVRHCINPSHVEPVTHLENMRRGIRAKGTHCKNGHPYDRVYTTRQDRRRRGCSQCHNEAVKRWRAANTKEAK